MVRGLPGPLLTVPFSRTMPAEMSRRVTFDTVCADNPVICASSTRLMSEPARRTASRMTASLYSPKAGKFAPRLTALDTSPPATSLTTPSPGTTGT